MYAHVERIKRRKQNQDNQKKAKEVCWRLLDHCDFFRSHQPASLPCLLLLPPERMGGFQIWSHNWDDQSTPGQFFPVTFLILRSAYLVWEGQASITQPANFQEYSIVLIHCSKWPMGATNRNHKCIYIYTRTSTTQLYWSGKATKLYLSQHTAGGCHCCCLSCWVWGSYLKSLRISTFFPKQDWKTMENSGKKDWKVIQNTWDPWKHFLWSSWSPSTITQSPNRKSVIPDGNAQACSQAKASSTWVAMPMRKKASVKVCEVDVSALWGRHLATTHQNSKPQQKTQNAKTWAILNHRFQAFESSPRLSPGCMPILPFDCWDLQRCSGSHSEANRYRIRWWDDVCGLQFIVSSEILCSKSIKVYAIMCSYITGPAFSLSVPCSVGWACVEDLYWRWSFQ